MKVLFMPCYLDGLPTSSASVRFRAEWPAKYWDDADVYPHFPNIPAADWAQRYDAYVFQKAYLTAMPQRAISALRAQGKLLAFDMCDADWLLSYEHGRRLLKVLPMFDFAVATTEPVRDYLSRWVPCHVIPDRLDLDEFTVYHQPHDGKPTVVWFGYAHNLAALDQFWYSIELNALELTIISNALPPPWNERSVRFVPWTREGANAEIAKHDIALLPPPTEYKSHNRLITAWALGVPAATTVAELFALLDAPARLQEAELRYTEVQEKWDVRISAKEWQELLSHYDRKRKEG